MSKPQLNKVDVDMLLENLMELGYRFTRPLVERSSYLTEPTTNKIAYYYLKEPLVMVQKHHP